MEQLPPRNEEQIKCVSFSSLVRGITQEIRDELQDLVEDLPTQSEDSRYDRTSLFVGSSRKKLLEVIVFLKWLESDGGKRQQQFLHTIDFLTALRNRHAYLDKIQDDLYFLHRNLYSNRSRRLPILPAIDILVSRSYRFLPQSIATLGQETKTELMPLDELLPNLEYFLKLRLLCLDSAITSKFDEIFVSNGKMQLTQLNNFTLILTLRNLSADSGWRVVGFDVLLSVARCEKMNVVRPSFSQTLSVIQILNSRKSMKSDESLYQIIASADKICSYMKLTTLRNQARHKSRNIDMEVAVESKNRNKMTSFYFVSGSSVKEWKDIGLKHEYTSLVACMRLQSLQSITPATLMTALTRRSPNIGNTSASGLGLDAEDRFLFRLDADVYESRLRLVVVPTSRGRLYGITESTIDDLREDNDLIVFGEAWSDVAVASCLSGGISFAAILLRAKESAFKRKIWHVAHKLEHSVEFLEVSSRLSISHVLSLNDCCIRLIHRSRRDLIEISMDSSTSSFVVLSTVHSLSNLPPLKDFEGLLNLPSSSNNAFTEKEIDPLILSLKIMCLSIILDSMISDETSVMECIGNFSSLMIDQFQVQNWNRRKAKQKLFDDEEFDDKIICGGAVLVGERIADSLDAMRLNSIKSYLIDEYPNEAFTLPGQGCSISAIQNSFLPNQSKLSRFGLSFWRAVAIVDDCSVVITNWVGWRSNEAWMKNPSVILSSKVCRVGNLHDVLPACSVGLRDNAIDLFDQITYSCLPLTYNPFSISRGQLLSILGVDLTARSKDDVDSCWKKLPKYSDNLFNVIYRILPWKTECLVVNDAFHFDPKFSFEELLVRNCMIDITEKWKSLYSNSNVEIVLVSSSISVGSMQAYVSTPTSSFSLICSMSLLASLMESFRHITSIVAASANRSRPRFVIVGDYFPSAIVVKIVDHDENILGTLVPLIQGPASEAATALEGDLLVCHWIEMPYPADQDSLAVWSRSLINRLMVELFYNVKVSDTRLSISGSSLFQERFEMVCQARLGILSLIRILGPFLPCASSASHKPTSSTSPQTSIAIEFGSSSQNRLNVSFVLNVNDDPSFSLQILSEDAMIDMLSGILLARIPQSVANMSNQDRMKFKQLVSRLLSDCVSVSLIVVTALDSQITQASVSVVDQQKRSEKQLPNVLFPSHSGQDLKKAIENIIANFLSHCQSTALAGLKEHHNQSQKPPSKRK